MNDRLVLLAAPLTGGMLFMFAGAAFDSSVPSKPVHAAAADAAATAPDAAATAPDARPAPAAVRAAGSQRAASADATPEEIEQTADSQMVQRPESVDAPETAGAPERTGRPEQPANVELPDIEPDVPDPTQPSPLLREALEAEPAATAAYESALELLAAADDPQRPLLDRLADVEEALALLEQLAAVSQHHPADLEQRLVQARGAIDRLRAAPVAAPLWSGEQIPDITLRARVVVQGGTTEAVMEVDGVPYRVVEGEELLIPSSRGNHRLRIVELNGDVLRVEIPPLRGALVFR